MITLTFAGDEAGDVSFTFASGASRYFVVAMVATENPDRMRQQLAELRQNSGLPAQYEFSFHRLSSRPLRARVFHALAESDFEAWAIIVDKTSLPDVFRLMPRLSFYLYFVSELICAIPLQKRESATLILDQFGSPEQVRRELRRVLKVRGIQRSFKRVLVRRSKSESLIQVADLIAGAILRRDSKNDSEAHEFIQGKLKQVIEFHP